jgi:uridine kinase
MATKPYLIGITGGSGSGKTSIIHELRDQFPEEQLCIISQDELIFLKPSTTRPFTVTYKS